MQNHQAVFRMISFEHLSQAEAELQQQHSDGLFNNTFFQERLTGFRYIPQADFGGVKSILIVAIPQPTLTLAFRYKGSEHPVTLPPTYDQQTDLEVQESIGKILIPAGYRLSRARIPEKVMATHSGLMQYGRNNIGYIPGMGSFYRPVAFFTDLSCEEDHWEAPVMLERCLRCRACIKACPTKAIGEDRFLLHAERCITFHNEHLKEIPGYIKPSMHHCLLGCMICQKVCPENRQFVDRVEVKENFSEEETDDILNGMPYDQLELYTRKKLDRLSLTEDYSLLARNLGLLLLT
jgi:epoxyqueuosine reductase